MKYEQLKETIQKYQKIVVTGPQRSGTRFAAKAIAYDFDLTYVDEAEIMSDNEELVRSRLSLPFLEGVEGKCVIQAPCFITHALYLPFDVLVIFMKRGISDIMKSEKRINWRYQQSEFSRFKEWKNILDMSQPVSKVKYDFYEKVYKKEATCQHEMLEYASLEQHPLWIKKKDRKNFTWNQTKLLQIRA